MSNFSKELTSTEFAAPVDASKAANVSTKILKASFSSSSETCYLHEREIAKTETVKTFDIAGIVQSQANKCNGMASILRNMKKAQVH